jgi:uncharacterized protein YjbI with pentapeptide repeats
MSVIVLLVAFCGHRLLRLHGIVTSRHRLYLDGVKWSGRDLRTASLYDASLRRAQLVNCDLRGTDLRNADLGEADLDGADLRDAKLQGVNLKGASYTDRTRWPAGFDPRTHGAVTICAVPP